MLLWDRYRSLILTLPPATKTAIAQQMITFAQCARYLSSTTLVQTEALKVIAGAFPKASMESRADFATYLLGATLVRRVADMTYEEALAARDKLQSQKDSISEMSEADMFALQRMMEQKSQLEQMISNVMKASSESQNTLASSLKAS